MITIRIPNNNIPERTYAVKLVFQYFLGLDIEIIPQETEKIIISWASKRIVFDDTFWKGNDCLQYLNIQYLPKVTYITSEFSIEKDLPVLYGTGTFIKERDCICCGIDVFASVFFMVTRWEEYIVRDRDQYDRFIGKNSVAYKNAFLDRPVVNEYVELIWNMLVSLGFEGNRKARSFEVVLTHDVDDPFMRLRFLRVTKYICQSIIQGHIKEAIGYIPDYFKDSYDTYDFLMDISESIKVKSHFYFMSAHWHTSARSKSPYIGSHLNRIIDKVKKRGHFVGFHPGFFSIDSLDNWREEKVWIEEITKQTVNEGRQHFLRFSVPQTFSIWEDNHMNIDSTLSYHDVEGFRCGTGDAYPVFDILKRKEYQLKERPLVLMDGTVTSYQQYSMDKISVVMNYYLNVGKKYAMPITLLFHNSSFLGCKGRQLKKIYATIFTNLHE